MDSVDPTMGEEREQQKQKKVEEGRRQLDQEQAI